MSGPRSEPTASPRCCPARGGPGCPPLPAPQCSISAFHQHGSPWNRGGRDGSFSASVSCTPFTCGTSMGTAPQPCLLGSLSASAQAWGFRLRSAHWRHGPARPPVLRFGQGAGPAAPSSPRVCIPCLLSQVSRSGSGRRGGLPRSLKPEPFGLNSWCGRWGPACWVDSRGPGNTSVGVAH